MFGDRCGVWSHVLKQVYIQKIKKKKHGLLIAMRNYLVMVNQLGQIPAFFKLIN